MEPASGAAARLDFSLHRLALVTGGASGIGLGVAQRLLGLGADVAIADLPRALDRLDGAQPSRFIDEPPTSCFQSGSDGQQGNPRTSTRGRYSPPPATRA